MKITKENLEQIIKEEIAVVLKEKQTNLEEGFFDQAISKIKNAFARGSKKGGKADGPKAAAAEIARSVEQAFKNWDNKKNDDNKKAFVKIQRAYDQLEDKFVKDGVWPEVEQIMEPSVKFFQEFAKTQGAIDSRGPARSAGDRLTRVSNRQAAANLKDKRRKDAEMDARMRARREEPNRTRSKFS